MAVGHPSFPVEQEDRMKRLTTSALAIALAGTLAACGGNEAEKTQVTPLQPDRTQLVTADNRDRVTLDGSVASVGADSFMMNYGGGAIRIELDDWDSFDEARLLRPGERVIVSGRVDDDFGTNRTVEAGSVFVSGLNTIYLASVTDEEQLNLGTLQDNEGIGAFDYTGRITSIAGRTFEMGTRPGVIAVDTRELTYDPFDTRGFQRLKEGDRVYVWGNLRFSGDDAMLTADGVVKLAQGQGGTPSDRTARPTERGGMGSANASAPNGTSAPETSGNGTMGGMTNATNS